MGLVATGAAIITVVVIDANVNKSLEGYITKDIDKCSKELAVLVFKYFTFRKSLFSFIDKKFRVKGILRNYINKEITRPDRVKNYIDLDSSCVFKDSCGEAVDSSVINNINLGGISHDDNRL